MQIYLLITKIYFQPVRPRYATERNYLSNYQRGPCLFRSNQQFRRCLLEQLLTTHDDGPRTADDRHPMIIIARLGKRQQIIPINTPSALNFTFLFKTANDYIFLLHLISVAQKDCVHSLVVWMPYVFVTNRVKEKNTFWHSRTPFISNERKKNVRECTFFSKFFYFILQFFCLQNRSSITIMPSVLNLYRHVCIMVKPLKSNSVGLKK